MPTSPETIPWPTGAAPHHALCSEPARLAVLGSYEWDTLLGDAELAKLSRFAARLCGTNSAAVSLVEAERQVFLAKEGLDEADTARSTSLCAHAMLEGDILEVRDCSQDPRFAGFEAVNDERHLRFYAGAPLISSEGAPLGALCVLDSAPRLEGLSELQREGLTVLCESVKRRIESHREAARAVSEIKASADRLQFMLDSVPDIAWSAAPGPIWDYFNARFTEATGVTPPKTTDDWRVIIHPDDFEASRLKLTDALKRATFFEDEWRLRLADGTYRWVLSRAVPSTNDQATARWFGTLTDIDDRHRLSQERELLAGELAHRIKNIFSVITGLITLRAHKSDDIQAFGRELSENVLALSRAQDFALRSDPAGPDDLFNLLELILAPYDTPGTNAVSISGDNIRDVRDAATPLAMVFHELATNSAKYGAFSVEGGRVAISVKSEVQEVTIVWNERGGPTPVKPAAEGFGSRLIAMTVNHQLDGQIERDWETSGLRIRIVIPRNRLISADENQFADKVDH